jgi:AcrR family transcriptional regulator
MSTGIERRSRRSTEQIRSNILGTAHDLFERQGYEETTTSQIAAQAQVGERLIFANFGSKAQLFQDSLVAPLSEWLARHLEAWERDPHTNQEESIRRFIDGLFELAYSNRRVLLSLMATHEDKSAMGRVAEAVRTQLVGAFGRMQQITSEVSSEVPGLSPKASTAVAAGAVLACALLQDWLSPEGERHPTQEEVVEELTTMLCYGMLRRPLPISRRT